MRRLKCKFRLTGDWEPEEGYLVISHIQYFKRYSASEMEVRLLDKSVMVPGTVDDFNLSLEDALDT